MYWPCVANCTPAGFYFGLADGFGYSFRTAFTGRAGMLSLETVFRCF
jgi:hypothetical protein